MLVVIYFIELFVLIGNVVFLRLCFAVDSIMKKNDFDPVCGFH